VELTGEVVPAPEHAEPFEAPLSGTQNCVVAGWEVEEWSETGDQYRPVRAGCRARRWARRRGGDRGVRDAGDLIGLLRRSNRPGQTVTSPRLIFPAWL
jgi:hypothetical protein